MPVNRESHIRSTRSNKGLRFTKSQKQSIIGEVEQGSNRKDVCVKYGIAYLTLCKWLRDAQSTEYKGSQKSNWSKTQKRAIVRSVLEGNASKDEACARHNIRKDLLNYWISAFKKEEQQLALNPHTSMPLTQNAPDNNSEAELQKARLKIKALETLIDVAEEQFKINIRKKHGAKQ